MILLVLLHKREAAHETIAQAIGHRLLQFELIFLWDLLLLLLDWRQIFSLKRSASIIVIHDTSDF